MKIQLSKDPNKIAGVGDKQQEAYDNFIFYKMLMMINIIIQTNVKIFLQYLRKRKQMKSIKQIINYYYYQSISVTKFFFCFFIVFLFRFYLIILNIYNAVLLLLL